MGTKVVLTIQWGNQSQTFNLTRANIAIHPVTYMDNAEFQDPRLLEEVGDLTTANLSKLVQQIAITNR